jgi:hypothetical protein
MTDGQVGDCRSCGLAVGWPGRARPLAAWAQNAIQSITSTQQAGTEVVRIELSEPLAACRRASRSRRRRASRSTCPA